MRIRPPTAVGARLRPIGTALGFLLCAASALPARQDPGSPAAPEIEAVRLVGNESLDPELILGALATRPTTCRSVLVALACMIGDFDWAELKQFLQDTAQVSRDAERIEVLYEIWGYPDATAQGRIVPQDDGDVVVEFEIGEGPPIVVRSIAVRGLESFAPPVPLPDPLPLAAGEPYALPRLESTQQLIRDRLADRGHPYTQVEVSGEVDESARAATVVLDVVPGPVARFGETAVTAEEPIDREAVLSRVPFRPGDVYRPSAVERAHRLLYDLPVVERAAVSVDGLLARDTMLPTQILVEARRVHGIEMEGTISSTDCLELAGFWRHRYFLGAPRLFALGGGVSNLFASRADGSFPCSSTGSGDFAEVNHLVRAELWQPSLFGTARNQLVLSGYTRRESSPNAFVQEGWGVSAAVSRDLGRGFHGRVTGRVERNELDAAAIYFCGNYGVCAADGIEQLSSARWWTPLEAVVIWTSEPEILEPRPPERRPGTDWYPWPASEWRYGVRAALEGAGGATGSEHGYTRALLEATGTRRVGRTGELALRARTGLLSGDHIVPPQVRLYSGGVQTVRGVEQNLLGPSVLVADTDDLAELCPSSPDCSNGVDPERVTVRPTGGDRLIEMNLEGRLWLTDSFQLAGFLDYGTLWRGAGAPDAFLEGRRDARLTPGLGFRLLTDIGPIRVDVGYDPSGARERPLVAGTAEGGLRHLGDVRFDPYGFDDPGWARELWRRMQFHVSIGQAF